MNAPWLDWNQTGTRTPPAVLDATLSEVAADPDLPDPTPELALEWMARCRRLGLWRHELLCLRESADAVAAATLLEQLLELGWDGDGAVLAVQDGWGWPARLLDLCREARLAIELRWLPYGDAAGPIDLGTVGRLRERGVGVSLVLPEAHQMDPLCLSRWVREAVGAGVEAIELVGRQGAPWSKGIQSLVQFVSGLVDGRHPEIGWSSDHGLGLALSQSLAAWQAGARRLRASLFGCGPAGNPALELLLLNLDADHAGAELTRLCAFGEESFDLSVGQDHPVFGPDAFRTTTGFQASAIARARSFGQNADLLVSSIPAHSLGLAPSIEVGPLAGQANLSHWLESHGLRMGKAQMDLMLEHVRSGSRVLSELELLDLAASE